MLKKWLLCQQTLRLHIFKYDEYKLHRNKSCEPYVNKDTVLNYSRNHFAVRCFVFLSQIVPCYKNFVTGTKNNRPPKTKKNSCTHDTNFVVVEPFFTFTTIFIGVRYVTRSLPLSNIYGFQSCHFYFQLACQKNIPDSVWLHTTLKN